MPNIISPIVEEIFDFPREPRLYPRELVRALQHYPSIVPYIGSAFTTKLGMRPRKEFLSTLAEQSGLQIFELALNHRPDLVGRGRRRTVLAQLRLDPALGRFVAQLQAHLAIQTAHPLSTHQPALAPQQHMDAPIAIAYPGLGDLPDPLHQNGLTGPFGTVVIGRSVHRQSLVGTPDADLPNHLNRVDHLSFPGRPHIFRRITSCSISLSSDRSATSFFSRWFSSSSCFSRFISDGSSPPYFLRQA